MKTYLDSSFLFSLYAPDQHSSNAASAIARTRGELVLSSLSEVELTNALELRIFRRELTRVQVEKAQAAFDEDVQRGVLRIFEVVPGTFSRTKDLILQITASLGCRTADILHVAAALEAKAGKLFTFDQRQRELARRVKLATNWR